MKKRLTIILIILFRGVFSQSTIQCEDYDNRNHILDSLAFGLFKKKYFDNKLTDLMTYDSWLNHKIWLKYRAEIKAKVGETSYMLTDCLVDTTKYFIGDTSRQGAILFTTSKLLFQSILNRDLGKNIMFSRVSRIDIDSSIKNFVHHEMLCWPIFIVKGRNQKIIVMLYPDNTIALIEIIN